MSVEHYDGCPGEGGVCLCDVIRAELRARSDRFAIRAPIPAPVSAATPPRPQWSLLPASIDRVVELLTWAAATKHKDEQGRAKPLDEQYDSLMRHIRAWRAGEIIDPDSGYEHMTCAAARALFIVDQLLKQTNKGEPK